jgi:hypothetical protein
MTLASDALSHVALPGIGVALALGINPVLGGVTALLLGTTLVWALEHKTRVPTKALIGVTFSAALAIGSMLTSGEDLLEALFGESRRLGWVEIVASLAASLLVVTLVLRTRHRLVITLVSADLARTAGIDVVRLDLLYLLVFGLTVVLGAALPRCAAHGVAHYHSGGHGTAPGEEPRRDALLGCRSLRRGDGARHDRRRVGARWHRAHDHRGGGGFLLHRVSVAAGVIVRRMPVRRFVRPPSG